MRDELNRLKAWHENIIKSSQYLHENDLISCSFKLGFMVQALQITIAEFESEKKDD